MFAATLLPASLCAQAADPFHREIVPTRQAVHGQYLHVKLREGCGAEWVDGRLHSRTGHDLSAIERVLASATVEPLVPSLSWDQLDELHRNATAALPPGRRPGHMGLWFRVTSASVAASAQLLTRLDGEALVECVHYEPRLYGASAGVSALPGGDIPPTTPLFTSLQASHAPSPLGHGVRRANGILGARGRSVGFRMVEGTYFLDHEDVCQLVAGNFIGPVPPFNPADGLHGLSGASIIAADRNGYGITGVADEVSMRFLSMDTTGGYANTVLLATANSQPGDVLMAIVMVLVPGLGPGSFLPAEFLQSAFDASLTATAAGRIMIVAAGNGARNLDDPALLNRFDRSFRDSGAIMVGASDAGQLVRASYCNWGSRVDAHSWGNQVVACGYGDLFYPNNDMRQAYTQSATGTSSATPHVAAVVCALQGAARWQNGQPLTTPQILALLHAHGPTTPDVIGRRPDLPAMLQAIGAFDGLAVDEPDVQLGGTFTVTMDGPPNSLAALFGAFATADLPLGFNRNVHLDVVTMASIGAFVLAPTASWSLTVPNDPTLHGTHVYFQAARLTGAQPLHLTNSCHVTVL
jgi:serine protease